AGTTCFVCVTDRVAFEVLARLRQWSVDVPGTVSVTGFDAVQAYMPSNPPTLTSVDPLWIEIGRAAMSLAMRRLTQPSAPQMTLTVGCRFVEGETLGPPGA
ncbi:MAG TPA: substrate-binding domain-containing protein, partial [Phycisphaeraceae bacterium]